MGRYERCEGSSSRCHWKVRKALQGRSALLQSLSSQHQPAATIKQDQLFVLETRDALDSDLTFASTAQDVAAVNLNLVHPLTGPVYIEGAKRG